MAPVSRDLLIFKSVISSISPFVLFSLLQVQKRSTSTIVTTQITNLKAIILNYLPFHRIGDIHVEGAVGNGRREGIEVIHGHLDSIFVGAGGGLL